MGYLLTITLRLLGTMITSVGSHLSLTVTGIFFLAAPVTFSGGAYAMVIFQKAGMGLPLSLILSMVFIGILAGFFAVAYIKMSNDSYAVLTLTSIVAMEALIKSWDSMTGGMMGIAGITRPELFSELPHLVIGLAVVTFLIVAFEYALFKTAFGRHMMALKENREALNSLGVSDKRTGAKVVIMAAMLAALAGIFAVWRIQYLDPSFAGIFILLQTLTIAILAYRPKVLYLVLATVFVILLPEVLRFFHFSSVILGHMRTLLYSLFVMVMIAILSKGNAISERSY